MNLFYKFHDVNNGQNRYKVWTVREDLYEILFHDDLMIFKHLGKLFGIIVTEVQ